MGQRELIDGFGRVHDYLRISITDRCNFRCVYCMPAEGITLAPRDEIMRCEEILDIARAFVKRGVRKIRLTGGEPLVRKDFVKILDGLGAMPVQLAITTNGALTGNFIEDFKRNGLRKVNVSLDSITESINCSMTRRDELEQVMKNIHLLVKEGFDVKLNAVVLKDVNEDEVIHLINLSKDLQISVRFIEFMPFKGNNWKEEDCVTQAEMMKNIRAEFGMHEVIKIEDKKNDTARNFSIKGYQGSFGFITTVSNVFCETCNRMRISSKGIMKNCLFDPAGVDLLSAIRQGEGIEELVNESLRLKRRIRAGMETNESFGNLDHISKNDSMIQIGG